MMCRVVPLTAVLVLVALAVFPTTQAYSPCLLPKVIGPCHVAHARFYFDVNTGKCERFYYGGCQGNANRFRSLEECQVTCGH
ncbi:PI-stichotoxin-Hmg3b-like [Panulirus ornatus]|uniref:PI-stichotoxin-Hmg3b-like n=1 Tax=Panulirus ornatus TaxID=150431 RepID=UPI003A837AA8